MEISLINQIIMQQQNYFQYSFQNLIELMSSTISVFNKTSQFKKLVDKSSLLPELQPLVLDSTMHYIHKKCQEQYDRSVHLLKVKDAQSLIEAMQILAILFEKIRQYETDQQTYLFKQQLVFNYWKLLQDIVSKEQLRQSLENEISINPEIRKKFPQFNINQINDSLLLQVLRMSHLFLKTELKKLCPRKNNLSLIILILAREQFREGHFNQTIKLCNQIIQTTTNKNAHVYLKASFLKSRAYQKLNMNEQELVQIKKCLLIARNLSAKSESDSRVIGNDFCTILIKRKYQLLNPQKTVRSISAQAIEAKNPKGFRPSKNMFNIKSIREKFMKQESHDSYFKKSLTLPKKIQQQPQLQQKISKRTLSPKKKSTSKKQLQIPPINKPTGIKLKIDRSMSKNLTVMQQESSKIVEQVLNNVTQDKNSIVFQNYLGTMLSGPKKYRQIVKKQQQKRQQKIEQPQSHQIFQNSVIQSFFKTKVAQSKKFQQTLINTVKSLQQEFLQKFIIKMKNQELETLIRQAKEQIQFPQQQIIEQQQIEDQYQKDLPNLPQRQLLQKLQKQLINQIIFNEQIGWIKSASFELSVGQKMLNRDRNMLGKGPQITKVLKIQGQIHFLKHGFFRGNIYHEAAEFNEQITALDLMKEIFDRYLNKGDTVAQGKQTNMLAFIFQTQLQIKKSESGTSFILNQKLGPKKEQKTVQVTIKDQINDIFFGSICQQSRETFRLINSQNEGIYLTSINSLSISKLFAIHTRNADENKNILIIWTELDQNNVLMASLIQQVPQTFNERAIKRKKLVNNKNVNDGIIGINLLRFANFASFLRQMQQLNRNIILEEKKEFLKFFSKREITIRDHLAQQISQHFMNYKDHNYGFLSSLIKQFLQCQYENENQIYRFFKVEAFYGRYRIGNRVYDVKLLNYHVKKMYEQLDGPFLKLKFNDILRRNLCYIMVAKWTDIQTIIGNKNCQNKSKLQQIKCFFKRLQLKRIIQSKRFIVDIDDRQMFLMNNFRQSIMPFKKLIPKYNCDHLSFFGTCLKGVKVILQKTSKLEYQQNKKKKCLFVIISVVLIENSQIANLYFYFPKTGRVFSLEITESLLSYLEEYEINHIFNQESNKKSQEQCLFQLFNKKSSKCFFIWSKMIQLIKFSLKYYNDQEIIKINISNYEGFLKDSSQSQNGICTQSVYNIKFTLNFVSNYSYKKQNNQKDKVIVSNLKEISTICQSQANQYRIFTSITEQKTGRKINCTLSLADIFNFIKRQFIILEFFFDLLSKDNTQDLESKRKKMDKIKAISLSDGEFDEKKFSYAQILRALHIIQNKYIEQISKISDFNSLFENNQAKRQLQKAVRLSIKSTKVEKLSLNTCILQQKKQKVFTNKLYYQLIFKKILNVEQLKTVCVFSELEKNCMKAIIYSHKNLKRSTLIIQPQHVISKYLDTFQATLFYHLKQRLFVSQKSKLLLQ